MKRISTIITTALSALMITASSTQASTQTQHQYQPPDLTMFLPYYQCYVKASQMYDIPVDTLLALSYNESGFDPYQQNHNKNNTIDYGIMQINTVNVRKYHLTPQQLLDDPCINILTGASILRDCMDTFSNINEAISCYNTGGSWYNSNYVKNYLYSLYLIHKLQNTLQYKIMIAPYTTLPEPLLSLVFNSCPAITTLPFTT